jgi:hypothetical protein
MREHIIYISDDGQRWETEEECRAWEDFQGMLQYIEKHRSSFFKARMLQAIKKFR